MSSEILTIQQAAGLLNVTEAFVNELVSNGTLPLDGEGLRRSTVLSYRDTRDRERESSLQEMVALGEEHDLPY